MKIKFIVIGIIALILALGAVAEIIRDTPVSSSAYTWLRSKGLTTGQTEGQVLGELAETEANRAKQKEVMMLCGKITQHDDKMDTILPTLRSMFPVEVIPPVVNETG